jgi:hypothetical protein
MTDTSPAFTHQPLKHQLSRDQRNASDSKPARFPAITPSLRQELHYRQLERQYYESTQYAAMVERYPLLQSSIAACRSLALISDTSAPLLPAPLAPAHLHWERSHGEG